MRREPDQLTPGEWLQLKHDLSSVAFNRLVKTARAGGIKIPAAIGVRNSSPKILFSTLSETARYVRSQDMEATTKFNWECENWSLFVTAELRSAARSFFGDNPKKDEAAKTLAESIRGNVRYDKKYKIEVQSLGFSFARHGVYLHYGASKGYGGSLGSQWTDKHGIKHKTNPESLGKMNTGHRKAVHWFNPVLKKYLPSLADIAAEYCLDMTLNLNSLFLEE